MHGYFDLGRYNLDEYYRYHTENGEGKYIDKNIVERPTGLHLYLYLLERYFIGLPEEQCCKGAYPRDALASFKLGEDVCYMDETPAYRHGRDDADPAPPAALRQRYQFHAGRKPQELTRLE